MEGFRRKLTINIILVFSVAAVMLVGARILVERLETAGAAILKERAEYVSKSKAAERLASLKQESISAEEFQKKIELFLPVQDQLLSFPDFIRTIANQHQVFLTFIFLPNSIIPPGVEAGSVGFTLSVSGPLQNVEDFMEAIEKKTKRFWIGMDSMDLVRSGEDYGLQGQGRVFFR